MRSLLGFLLPPPRSPLLCRSTPRPSGGDLMMAENYWDFVDYLGPDTSISVLTLLGDPADLVRASSVSHFWRRFIITNAFFKNLCFRMCPEVSKFTGVMEIKGSQEAVDVGSSTSMEWQILEMEHRAYTYLSRCLMSPRQKDCILESIVASSTDNYPDESIENTLVPSDRVRLRPCYWSSGGKSDPEAPETLTYRLCSNLCVVNEIKIQPFEAFFQYGNPIYAAKAVRFRMGHSMLNQGTGTDITDGNASRRKTADDKYVWTYVSPEFPMAQENVLQSFKLPRPVFCIGGIVQIELLGRVQKQEIDDLYYICVCHVQVIGHPLSPVFDVDVLESSGNSVLKYFPDARSSASPEGAPSSESKVMETTYVNSRAADGWNHTVLNAFLGTVFVADDFNGSDDEEEEPIAWLHP